MLDAIILSLLLLLLLLLFLLFLLLPFLTLCPLLLQGPALLPVAPSLPGLTGALVSTEPS